MADPTPLVVLGAGPGGHAAAFLAADLGMPVILVDEEANPGGVCTYRGCIPSKALLHVAKLLEETKHASNWGIDFGPPTIDVARLRNFKQGVVDRLTGGLGQLTRQRKITYLQGRGSFVDAHTLKVALTAGGEQVVRFEKLIIATGSRPATLPNVNVSKERLLDSTGALELSQIPKRLLVIGGGYIGLELGSVYAALGSEVSVVEMIDRLLPGADKDLVNVLAKRIRKICKQVLTSTKVANMEEKADGVHVTFEGELEQKTQVFDQILVSIGRRPNGHIPGIETTGVEVTARGFITVDPQRRTTVPHIYAIGDVAGDPMLAHKATYDAKIAVEHIAGHKVAFEPAAIPAVVFTDPELAWCGLTEAEAQERGIAVEVAKFPWGASGRATTVDRNDGLTKLIIEPKTERVLGVGIVGVNAGEMIAEGVLAVEMAATASDLKMTIHAHPTLSETVMESAEVFFGTATNYYKPKK
ncbi:dihydrolipoyl dehydrogenase [Luteitalea sp. TBR-22]|uniref:dihydrolipoyl dehydrogenase n=1 Tax=Luteitalea sp. TBR-22 TaxID=2802971 RepID=UPI001AFA2831|nr:dihydrolipoyl dehydrogenase [Luteitalea sp. TBR-22]BCS34391.1 dihydrolipoyl dehydrogenase [Luteitalea sp. TBR-22]